MLLPISHLSSELHQLPFVSLLLFPYAIYSSFLPSFAPSFQLGVSSFLRSSSSQMRQVFPRNIQGKCSYIVNKCILMTSVLSFFCLFDLILYLLAQGHNAVSPVRLKPAPLGLESCTLPLSHSLYQCFEIFTFNSKFCIG